MSKINLNTFKKAELIKIGTTGTAYCLEDNVREINGKDLRILKCIVVTDGENPQQLENQDIFYNIFKFKKFTESNFAGTCFPVEFTREKSTSSLNGEEKIYEGWSPRA